MMAQHRGKRLHHVEVVVAFSPHLVEAIRQTAIDVAVLANQHDGMRATLTLDDDIHEAAQHLARTSGEHLGKIVSELARRGLTNAPLDEPRQRKQRFATFDLPPGAPMIPASRVQNFLDEAGRG